MRRREFISIIGSVMAQPFAAGAQQQALPVIGFLSLRGAGGSDDLLAAFRNGLREAGFVEGQNVAIEYRWAEGQHDRLPALAGDLVRRQVNVIFANTSLVPAQVAKAATATIPIVFEAGADPVRLGLVESLNRPGGNVTGVTMFSGVVLSKRLGLLREITPDNRAIAMLFNPTSANAQIDTQDIEAAARELGLAVHLLPVAKAAEVDPAFAKLLERRAGALLVGSDPFIDTQRHRIVALAALHMVPAIYAWRFFVEAGGLMSYGSRIIDAYHQGGIYTGRVLRGEKPADLPILQPNSLLSRSQSEGCQVARPHHPADAARHRRRGDRMKRRTFITLLGGTAVAWPLAARAQQSERVRRIGYLANLSPASVPELMSALREGLRERGYVQGQNLTFEYRWAAEMNETLAAELVALNVDVIIAWATPAVKSGCYRFQPFRGQ